MGLIHRFSDEVEVVSPGTALDEYGNTAPSWETATSVPARGFFQLRSTREGADSGEREASRLDAVLYLRPETVVSARDRIVFDGATYAVDGEPVPSRAPGRAARHLRVALRRAEG